MDFLSQKSLEFYLEEQSALYSLLSGAIAHIDTLHVDWHLDANWVGSTFFKI